MADGHGLCEAGDATSTPASPPDVSPRLGWKERLRAGLAGTGASLWLVAGLGLLYALRVPLRLCENLAAGETLGSPREGWGRQGPGGADPTAEEGFGEGAGLCAIPWHGFSSRATARQLIVKADLPLAAPP